MINATSIPAWLRENGRFCAWRYETREGADTPTKVPYNPLTGAKLDCTRSDAFTGFNAAAAVQTRYDGLGVGVFNGLCAIDIDHCIDENGQLSELAADVLERMGAYAEKSPSGTGLHLLFLVAPGFEFDRKRYYINHRDLGLEVYVSGATNRFVTLTGDTQTPGADLEDRSEQLRALLERYMVRPGAVETPTGTERKPVPLSDDEIVEKALAAKNGDAFRALWEGNVTGHPSHSEADIALCNSLAFWTNGDPERVDRLFRRSGLMREKWDQLRGAETYGATTVANAVRTLTFGYDPAEYSRRQALKELKNSHAGGPMRAISARDLQTKEFAPLKFIVDGIVPPGLFLLAAKSKIGKSWMVLDLCLSVAEGIPFLGCKTNQCGALYLALEDSERRLKGRMNKLLEGMLAPESFQFITKARDAEAGLIEDLTAHLDRHPETRLIVIDTLQKIRPPTTGRDGAYAQDYRFLSPLKELADERDICVLLVHHLRKMRDDGDLFDRISGTGALMGAADTIAVLHRENRGDTDTTFALTGRDVEPVEKILEFDRVTCRWCNRGDADVVAAHRAQLAYRNDALVVTIQRLLEENGGSWSGTAKDLLSEGLRITGSELAPNAQKLGYRLRELAPKLPPNGIMYRRAKNGNAGWNHCFSSAIVGELPQGENGINGFSEK